jgi:CRISPR type III-A-associated RAMP protein Csm4
MKIKTARIPLEAGSRFHFGEFRIDVNVGLTSTSVFAHSDTLFSAIINCAATIDNATNLVNAFGNSKVNISSLFYYLKQGDLVVYFLPKPVFLEKDNKIDGKHKKRNKIKFVSLGIWNEGLKADKWLDNESKYIILQDEFVLTIEEYGLLFPKNNFSEFRIYEITQSPKSPIRKIADESIYYQTDIVIPSNRIEIETGFYFLYEATDDTDIWLKDAVNILSKTGIGGEHNNMGQIMGDPVYGEIDITDNDTGQFTNVSLVNPKDVDEYNNILQYKTIIRGGRKLLSDSNYQVVRFILEGAELNVQSKIAGRLVEIGTDDFSNKAYRNGKAFLIPVYSCLIPFSS